VKSTGGQRKLMKKGNARHATISTEKGGGVFFVFEESL